MRLPRQTNEGEAKQSRVAAEHRYPVYDLDSSIEVARVIFERAGGAVTADHLAALLKYTTTNSGSFLARIAAARSFDLIERSGRVYVPTALAMRIITPEYAEDELQARSEAWLAVPLYKAIYERYEGKQLPLEVGLRNTLQTSYGIPANRTALAHRVLMDSAEQAGYFNARGGARSHLVRPFLSPISRSEREESIHDDEPFGGGRGGGGEGQLPPVAPTTKEQVQLEYIRKLIARLDNAEATELDTLTQRIERLLGLVDGVGAT